MQALHRLEHELTPTVWTRKDAEREAREDLRTLLNDSEKHDAAIASLQDWLGESGLERLRKIVAAESWWVAHHFASGMQVRNHLRENGFDEAELGIKNLDNVYVHLLEEAVRPD